MIRTALIYAFLAASIIFILPWYILWSALTRNPETMYSLSMQALRMCMRIAKVRVHIEGADNIPSTVCVFAANHASNLDPFVFFPAIPRRISVLIKKELLEIPILSTGMKAIKFVGVNRGDREAAAASVDEAVRNLREGLSFAVFAEGTRSPDGRLRPFKKGVVLMAIQAGVPIVPVAIAGTQNLMRKGSRIISPGEVTVHFAPPVDVAQFSIDQRNDLLAQLEATIAANLPPDQRPLADAQ
jgi:1-acyl-sn-glycerol-3-phosphate acyltransferase